MRLILCLGMERGYRTLEMLKELDYELAYVFILREDPHEEEWSSRIARLAAEWEIPHKITNSVKSNTKKILAIDPDLMVVVNWRFLIPENIFRRPRLGTICNHDAILPRYRGFAPLAWQIINGEKTTGTSIFYMENEVDSGDILYQKKTRIALNDDFSTLQQRLTAMFLDGLRKVLSGLKDGTAVGIPQDQSKATYTCKRTPDDSLIDFADSAENIYNKIRALYLPNPPAFAWLGGQRVIFTGARMLKNPRHYEGLIPGRVVGVGEWTEVLCGDGPLQVKTTVEVTSIKATFTPYPAPEFGMQDDS